MMAFFSRLIAICLILFIFYVIIFVGDAQSSIFLHLNSFLLVLFGSIGSCMLSFSLPQILQAFGRTAKSLYRDKTEKYKKKEIKQLIDIAQNIKKSNGLGCIDDLLTQNTYSPFLRFGLEIISSGYEPKKVLEMLDNFSQEDIFKQKKSEDLMQYLATIAPAFGMIGTVMGLIIMLTNLDADASNIGQGLAFALVTTLYGVLLSNVIFKPASVYLYEQRINTKNHNTALLMGLSKLQQRTDPIILQDYLNSYLSLPQQIKLSE